MIGTVHHMNWFLRTIFDSLYVLMFIWIRLFGLFICSVDSRSLYLFNSSIHIISNWKTVAQKGKKISIWTVNELISSWLVLNAHCIDCRGSAFLSEREEKTTLMACFAITAYLLEYQYTNRCIVLLLSFVQTHILFDWWRFVGIMTINNEHGFALVFHRFHSIRFDCLLSSLSHLTRILLLDDANECVHENDHAHAAWTRERETLLLLSLNDQSSWSWNLNLVKSNISQQRVCMCVWHVCN